MRNARIGIVPDNAKTTVKYNAESIVVTTAEHLQCSIERHPLKRICVVSSSARDIVRNLSVLGYSAWPRALFDFEWEPGA
jgi:hypothetical protein